MFNILLGALVWLLVQSSFAADEDRRLALTDSLDNKDIASTRGLLAAGTKPGKSMLLRCKTVEQARMLIAHGLSIKKESKDYGFLPERIPHDADPDLLTYFLEQIPLTVANRYAKETYIHLLMGLTEVKFGLITKDELRFDQKLQILIDHNCYYDHKGVMGMINCFNDNALDNDREGVKKRFETVAIDNEPKKRENVLSLLQQRSRTGSRPSNIKRLARTNLQHRYADEVCQYEEKKRIKTIAKGLSGLELELHLLFH